MLESQREQNNRSRTLGELTREEFYAMMNKALGMNIEPPQNPGLHRAGSDCDRNDDSRGINKT